MTAPNRPLLYVVRHGATEWSTNGRHTGTTDVPLLPEGERQAIEAGMVLSGIEFARVLSSPMARATRTCELAGLGDRMEVDDDLREWDYGDYEGITTPTIRELHPDWTIWSGPWPGGEIPAQVGRRADRVIAEVRSGTGPVVVFSHGHFLRVLAARWCELDPVEGRRFLLDPATVGILGWEHGIPAVSRWNAR